MQQRLTRTVENVADCNRQIARAIEEFCSRLEQPTERVDPQELLPVLDRMLDSLQQQFDLEEEAGYLEDVLEQYPNWYPQIRHLQQEHRLLHEQLRENRERVAQETSSSALSSEARRQLLDWMKTFEAHQQRENQLIQEAFRLEVGAGE